MVSLKIIIFLLVPLYTFGNECGHLYITESAENKHFILNWQFTCADNPDTIVLSSNDPNGNEPLDILTSIATKEIDSGYYETTFLLKDNILPGNWTYNTNNTPDLNARCFPFYISSYRNNVLVDSNCFSIQPNWMANYKSLKINNMMIPGTHNSGAYTSPLPEIVTNWVFTQNRNFWEQLVFGIRFMDLRIGRYGDPPNGTFINHGVAQCTLLLPELESVQNFLLKSPNEVVILNFHEFPVPDDFLQEYHKEVIKIIQQVFKDSIYSYTTSVPTLEECINSGKRVIISYNNEQIVEDNPWLWPEMTRYWGNVETVEDLKNYIDANTNQPPFGNPMSVIMAELTPSELYIATHLDKSLRYMADLVNRELDNWILNNKRYKNVNIIAVDYFTGNNMVSIAIEANKKLNKVTNF